MRLVPLLVCCLIACGDDGVRHTPDAAPHDGPADTAADAAQQPVTLTVTVGGAPAGGVKVYFLNADSSVVLNTVTDASGVASAVMAAGGSVTAVDPFGSTPSNYLVNTFEGVKPGDQLHLDQAAVTTPINVTITAPIDATAGISGYEVQTPCGNGQLTSAGSGASPTGTAQLYGCGPTTDLVIIARDSAFQVADYIYVHDAAISDGATLDLSAMTYTAAASRAYSFSNIPTGFSVQSYTDAVLTAKGAYLQISGNPPSNGSASSIKTMGAGTHWSQIALVGPAGYGQHLFFDWGPWAATYTTDVGARALPDLTTFPTFDPSLHAAIVSEATSGATPDAFYGVVNANRGNTYWSWIVAAPHATTVALPTLPSDVFDFNMVSTDSPYVSSMTLIKAPGGYDALRPYLLTYYGSAKYDPTTSAQVTTETIVTGFRGPRR